MSMQKRIVMQVGMALAITGLIVNFAVGEEKATKAEGKKVAYLGVATSPVSATLKKQLGLSNGAGLVVEHINPGSPADGKLQVDDILAEMNSQLLFNHDQLASLLRTFKSGDEVKLAVIRDGKSQLVTVKLDEKEMTDEVSSSWGEPIIHIAPPAIVSAIGMDADKMAKEIREQIEKQLKATGGTTNPQDILNALGGIGLGTPSGTGGGSTKRLGSGPARHLGSSGTKDHKVSNSTVSSHVSTVTSSDGDKTSTLTVVNGEKKLTVQDKDGKSIFDGSVTTDEQKNALTKEVKEILEKLENKADKVDVKVKVSTENAVN